MMMMMMMRMRMRRRRRRRRRTTHQLTSYHRVQEENPSYCIVFNEIGRVCCGNCTF